MNEIIFSLDASSTNVGWCLAQGDRYVDSGHFRPKGDRDERVAAIVKWTQQMIEKFSPDLLPIEEPMGHHRNLRIDRLLARVCGAIEAVAILADVPVLYVHCMSVKATGFSKDNLFEAALVAGKSRIGPDEADAIGVWQAALAEVWPYGISNLTSQAEV